MVRVSETYGKAIKGEVYEVSGVSGNLWAGSCGFEDYWAYGRFESGQDMISNCEKYSY